MTCELRLALAMVLVAAACSSNDGGSGIDAGVTSGRGSMSCKIDGVSWTSDIATTAAFTGGIMALGGSDGTNRAIGMALTNVTVPATFTLGGPESTNALLTVSGQTWEAGMFFGSGSITIGTLTATGATGTFELTAIAVAGTGATGTKVVTEGTFDVNF